MHKSYQKGGFKANWSELEIEVNTTTYKDHKRPDLEVTADARTLLVVKLKTLYCTATRRILQLQEGLDCVCQILKVEADRYNWGSKPPGLITAIAPDGFTFHICKVALHRSLYIYTKLESAPIVTSIHNSGKCIRSLFDPKVIGLWSGLFSFIIVGGQWVGLANGEMYVAAAPTVIVEPTTSYSSPIPTLEVNTTSGSVAKPTPSATVAAAPTAAIHTAPAAVIPTGIIAVVTEDSALQIMYATAAAAEIQTAVQRTNNLRLRWSAISERIVAVQPEFGSRMGRERQLGTLSKNMVIQRIAPTLSIPAFEDIVHHAGIPQSNIAKNLIPNDLDSATMLIKWRSGEDALSFFDWVAPCGYLSIQLLDRPADSWRTKQMFFLRSQLWKRLSMQLKIFCQQTLEMLYKDPR
ncbi:hypothetical protein DFJ77DRAFT_437474 [Powellomyces hirtus]|nr:hypothetical protein DFJ77DRAFT_437474 [Powellomyces hirtus]